MANIPHNISKDPADFAAIMEQQQYQERFDDI